MPSRKRISKSGFRDWKPSRLPDLTGKRYVITGGNSGIGFEAAKMLGAAGANLTIACRNLEKGARAKKRLESGMTGTVDLVEIDLSRLDSVRRAAEELKSRYDAIDALINNAGIMQTPKTTTVDGFDLQMASNHLGHFLWTGLLLEQVEKAKGRIAIVSSLVHIYGALNLNDLMSENRYNPTAAYAQSKLANLMYALELDRRLERSGHKAIAIACHPGYSNTSLQSTGPKGALNFIYKFTNPLMAQSAHQGAVPTVLAAAGKEAKRGGYYGPQNFSELRGRVSDARVAAHALDEDKAKRLWTLSEELVGFQYLSD
nr:oxidoreductase [Hyphomonas sp. Mor2]